MTEEKKKTIIPRAPYVLVKPIEPKEEKTESDSGLIIPDNVEEEQKAQGTVMRIPENKENVSGIRENDVIVYGAYAGEDLEMMEDGEKVRYKLIHDEDIIAFIR